MLYEYCVIALITLVPALEMQLSIPLGILSASFTVPFIGTATGFGLPWYYVALVAVTANILGGIAGFWALETVVHRMLLPRWPWFRDFYERQLARAQKKIHDDVHRWGWLGFAVFLALPFPGTGIYTGTLAAYGIGMTWKEYITAVIIGSLAAAIVILILTLGLRAVWIGFF